MGDNFDVNNIGQLYTDLDVLNQTNNTLAGLEQNLRTELARVKSAWKSDAQDKISAVDQLQKDINSLRNLIITIRTFSMTMTSFARMAERAAKN